MAGHGSMPARHDQQQTQRFWQLALLRYLDDIVAGKAVESIESAWLRGCDVCVNPVGKQFWPMRRALFEQIAIRRLHLGLEPRRQ